MQQKLFCSDQLGPISYKLKVERIAICKSSVKLFVAETFCKIDPWQENHKDQAQGVKGRSEHSKYHNYFPVLFYNLDQYD